MAWHWHEDLGKYFVNERRWTAQEVAQIFGVSRWTICRWAQERDICKEHGSYSFDENAIIEFARQKEEYELAYYRWKSGGDMGRIMTGEVDIY